MRRVGVDPAGIALMAAKEVFYNLKIIGLTAPQANILKQDAIASGGEAAVAKGVVSCEINSTDAVLSGTLKQLRRLADKLKAQPYGLPDAGKSINEALDRLTNRGHLVFRGRSRSFDVSNGALVMGVLNVTPDSFYDGGRHSGKNVAIEAALRMADEGADIIDVGGESSRPGAIDVPVEEEIRRVVPVVEELSKRGLAISVDTVKSRVADLALFAGAEAINDISAMQRDPLMAEVVKRHGAGVALMHMRGTPKTMQTETDYEDLMGEVFDYLFGRVEFAEGFGIEREKIAIDPGVGFAKTSSGCLEIIRRLGELKTIGVPVLIGTSRKSFIGKARGGAEAGERLIGTLATISAALLNGANIIRAHDVKETKETILMIEAIKRGEIRTEDKI
ncbi:MAG: dihydropteroate synthase [Thermodesulfobacteriota bacterium]